MWGLGFKSFSLSGVIIIALGLGSDAAKGGTLSPAPTSTAISPTSADAVQKCRCDCQLPPSFIYASEAACKGNDKFWDMPFAGQIVTQKMCDGFNGTHCDGWITILGECVATSGVKGVYGKGRIYNCAPLIVGAP